MNDDVSSDGVDSNDSVNSVDSNSNDRGILDTFSRVVDDQAFNDVFSYSFNVTVNKLIDSKIKYENKLIIDNSVKNKVLTIKDERDGWLVKAEIKE